MPRRPQVSRQQRRAAVETRLMEAAERLMRDGDSFTDLSVDRLATEAGISRATFYIYFEDKGDLIRRLAGRVFGELSDDAGVWWNAADRRDPGDLEVSMRRIIDSYRRHQALITALNEMSSYDASVATTYRQLLNDISVDLSGVITRGQTDGTIRTELPAQPVASALTWMVERACHQNLPHQPSDYDAELAAALTQIIWGALYLEKMN